MKNFVKIITAIVAVITSASGCQKFEITDSSMMGGVLTIHVGEYHLIGTDTEKQCAWTSSDPTVVSVFNSYIYGVAPGTCTVTGKLGATQRSVEVVVIPTDVMGFKFDTHEICVVPGFSSTFKVTDFDPDYASADMLTWGFSPGYPYNDHFNFSVSGNTVTVSADETTPSIAEALLTAHGYKGSTDDGVVDVCDDIHITVASYSVVLNSNRNITLEVGDTKQLEAELISGSEIFLPMTWSSSDPSVATCTDGLVQAVGEGEAKITVSCGSATDYCNVTVTEKRNLPEDYKICFYRNMGGGTGDYIELSDPISSIDVLRGGWARFFYVGAEDGLPIPKDADGNRGTAVYTNEKIFPAGVSYAIGTQVDFGLSASETSGSVTVTAPNGSKATLQVKGVFGSVSLLSPSGDVYSTGTSGGAPIALPSPTDNSSLRCCFAANLSSSYDRPTSYRIDCNDPGYINLNCVQDSEINWESFNDRWFTFTRDSAKKVYEFHIVDPATNGSKLDYVVKINLK
ncbi:MAG: Ig-like domain-containing protein [Bacteroidales bacterium]|nr:Ig-like domain-containing protein [Bacteroidales bacterium]